MRSPDVQKNLMCHDIKINCFKNSRRYTVADNVLIKNDKIKLLNETIINVYCKNSVTVVDVLNALNVEMRAEGDTNKT
ncbi:unnamed protein product [Didymodactylos carnosus]|uniref:Uncharacterized protein n=1 Tax=Didymodactylos carnosus TaxID=1234261 RepID=A0A815I9N3_9BILA|nr:unnamed protein product [Didymodactylos carnosus]CAF4247391.1 unnamed protein product [Didymodactylos carnosus]